MVKILKYCSVKYHENKTQLIIINNIKEKAAKAIKNFWNIVESEMEEDSRKTKSLLIIKIHTDQGIKKISNEIKYGRWMVDQTSRDRDVPREPIFKITDQNTAKNIDPTDCCWMKWLKNRLKAMWLHHTASKTMWPSRVVNQTVWLAALPTSPSRHSMRVMMKRHMTTQTASSKASHLIYLALI